MSIAPDPLADLPKDGIVLTEDQLAELASSLKKLDSADIWTFMCYAGILLVKKDGLPMMAFGPAVKAFLIAVGDMNLDGTFVREVP